MLFRSKKCCASCKNVEFKFRFLFSGLKEVCGCSVLKGVFKLVDTTDCIHYDFNSKWEERIEFARYFDEDNPYICD